MKTRLLSGLRVQHDVDLFEYSVFPSLDAVLRPIAHPHAAFSKQGAPQDPSSQANYPVVFSVTVARRSLEASHASALDCARSLSAIVPPPKGGATRLSRYSSTSPKLKTLTFLVETGEGESPDFFIELLC